MTETSFDLLLQCDNKYGFKSHMYSLQSF